MPLLLGHRGPVGGVGRGGRSMARTMSASGRAGPHLPPAASTASWAAYARRPPAQPRRTRPPRGRCRTIRAAVAMRLNTRGLRAAITGSEHPEAYAETMRYIGLSPPGRDRRAAFLSHPALRSECGATDTSSLHIPLDNGRVTDKGLRSVQHSGNRPKYRTCSFVGRCRSPYRRCDGRVTGRRLRNTGKGEGGTARSEGTVPLRT